MALGTPAQQAAVQQIIKDFEAQVIAAGGQDFANDIIPQLQNLENAPNIVAMQFQAGALLVSLAGLPAQIGPEVIKDAAGAIIAIVRVYIPAA